MAVMHRFDPSQAPSSPSPSTCSVVPAPDPTVQRLAAGLADTVNNALVGVIGSLELALREATPNTLVHDHIQESLDCALHAARTVRRLVAVASRPPVMP